MRIGFCAALLCVVPAACASNDASSPSAADPIVACELAADVVNITLNAGGATHSIRVFLPSAIADATVLPVVLNWHGNGWTGTDHAEYTQFEALAEDEGFIVVHPTGSQLPGVPVLESGLGWELVGALETPERDDLAFANALIDELITNWCADEERVYSTGLSNGAFFTAALVCELADRLAGASSIAGLYHPESCEPTVTVPYVAFAGIDDQLVPYETGGPTIYPELNDSAFVLGTFDAFAAFATDFGCDSTPAVAEVSEHVTRFDYLNCDDDVPMTLYAFDGVANGHSWPGAPGDSSTTHEIDATLESWRFFEQLTST